MKKIDLSRQIFAVVTATFSLLEVGFHSGWTVPALAKLLSSESEIPITPDQGSWIASLPGAGNIVSILLGIYAVDKLGRKTSLLITSIPTFIGWVLVACARSYRWYYAGRIIGGLGMGAVFVIVPIYIGEISHDAIRGGAGTLSIVMMHLGSVVGYSIGPWVNVSQLAWIGALFPIIFVATFFWASESPYYYSMNNEPLKTQKSLEWLRGTNDVDEAHRKVDATVEFDKQKSSTNIRDLVLVKSNRKAMLIVLGLMTGQLFSGTGAITSYSAVIFNEVMSSVNSSISVIICGVVQLVVAIGTVYLVDKVGRKPLLFVSTNLCMIFLLFVAVYFHLRHSGVDVTGFAWVSVLAIVGYLVSYAIGLGTVPTVMTGELFSCNAKAAGVSICFIYLALVGILVTKLYQIISDAYGIHVAFYGFSCCCILTATFIRFFVPETKGRSLNDIQNELD